MSSLPASTENPPPLAVVALGGNALSPPSGDPSYDVERQIVARTASELKSLIDAGYRLLIVPGNGPQVGRLMRDDVSGENLDIHVSQTQGELGYLLVASLRRAGVADCACLVTRTIVGESDAEELAPVKAVGPVLKTPPESPHRNTGDGFRLLVASPRPVEIPELPTIRRLLHGGHVVAGGGGGVAVTATGKPVQGVVDKDRVAAFMAVALEAAELVFVTNVAGAYEHYGTAEAKLLRKLDGERARVLSRRGTFGAGSMAPKIESAGYFASARNASAHITALGTLPGALRGEAGTEVVP